MSERPTTAMILAAGKGERLRPLTETTPKALLRLAGRPLIDHVVERLLEAGVEKAVVNLHHLGEQVAAHLDKRKDIEIAYSDERKELLGTGGGIAKALPLLGARPFYVINGDAPWFDSDGPSLQFLAALRQRTEAQAVLLLHPTVTAVGYLQAGDYFLDRDSRALRRRERPVVPFVYSGTQIITPQLFEAAPKGAFSIVDLFDGAETRGALYGLRHEGLWMQINTVDGLDAANRTLAAL